MKLWITYMGYVCWYNDRMTQFPDWDRPPLKTLREFGKLYKYDVRAKNEHYLRVYKSFRRYFWERV